MGYILQNLHLTKIVCVRKKAKTANRKGNGYALAPLLYKRLRERLWHWLEDCRHLTRIHLITSLAGSEEASTC